MTRIIRAPRQERRGFRDPTLDDAVQPGGVAAEQGGTQVSSRGLGERVRRAREAAGLSRKQLAKALGESERRLERIESDARHWSPNIAEIEGLSRTLNVSPSWIAYGLGDSRHVPDDPLRILCTEIEGELRTKLAQEAGDARAEIEAQFKRDLEAARRDIKAALEIEYRTRFDVECRRVRAEEQACAEAEIQAQARDLRRSLETEHRSKLTQERQALRADLEAEHRAAMDQRLLEERRRLEAEIRAAHDEQAWAVRRQLEAEHRSRLDDSLHELRRQLVAEHRAQLSEQLRAARAAGAAEVSKRLEHRMSSLQRHLDSELRDLFPPEPYRLWAVETLQQVVGEAPPDPGTVLNDLASIYEDQGLQAEAEVLYRRAISISEATLGPAHPEVAASLNNLAILLTARGQLDEAEALARRAYDLAAEAFGPDHSDTAAMLNTLGRVLGDRGRTAEAEPLLHRALKIYQLELGPQHPTTAVVRENLLEVTEAGQTDGKAEVSAEAAAPQRRPAPQMRRLGAVGVAEAGRTQSRRRKRAKSLV